MCDSKTRLYAIWKGIKRRCLNERYHHYCNYGGRGITLCDGWRSFQTFKEWAMANGYNDTLSIERKDNEGDYCPENCVWADRIEQNNNTRRNHCIEYRGGVYTVAELSRISGVRQNTLLYRLRRGWTVEDAVTRPLQQRRKA